MSVGHLLSVEIEFEDEPRASFAVVAEFTDDSLLRVENFRPNSTYEFPRRVRALFVYSPAGGYWPLEFHRPRDLVRGKLVPIPLGPGAWWHELHRAPPADGAGNGVKIGVIDEALPRQGPTSCIAHVNNLGGVAWDAGSRRAYEPFDVTNHGLAVCTLLASRPTLPADFVGMSPGADVVFAAAGSDYSEELDIGRLAEAIVLLVEDENCDLITFSAGDNPSPLPAVREALRAAQEHGVLCFAAAGNEGGAPLFPARYLECTAVGAVGDLRVAPEASADGMGARHGSPHLSGDLFHWSSSARGPDVDFLGAGVSIFASDGAGGWFPRSGTSFAAPIVAGLAAAALAKDQQYQDLKSNPARVNYALAKLTDLSFNPFPEHCRLGLPCLQR